MMNLGLMDAAFLGSLTSYDPDAAAYIAAVEAADGQALETGVKDAINAFVLGCKADGIWNAIKASCILAGARTLAGALVPMVGTAPTNFNFVAGDYNRRTGLVGNGSTKYLDTGRSDNADSQNSAHLSVYASTASTSGANTYTAYAGAGNNLNSFRVVYRYNSFIGAGNLSATSVYNRSALRLDVAGVDYTGFIATTRSSGSTLAGRAAQTNAGPIASASNAPAGLNIVIFGENANGVVGGRTNARLAFYSIGEALDLALLDARVTALVNALAVAIP